MQSQFAKDITAFVKENAFLYSSGDVDQMYDEFIKGRPAYEKLYPDTGAGKAAFVDKVNTVRALIQRDKFEAGREKRYEAKTNLDAALRASTDKVSGGLITQFEDDPNVQQVLSQLATQYVIGSMEGYRINSILQDEDNRKKDPTSLAALIVNEVGLQPYAVHVDARMSGAQESFPRDFRDIQDRDATFTAWIDTNTKEVAKLQKEQELLSQPTGNIVPITGKTRRPGRLSSAEYEMHLGAIDDLAQAVQSRINVLDQQKGDYQNRANWRFDSSSTAQPAGDNEQAFDNAISQLQTLHKNIIENRSKVLQEQRLNDRRIGRQLRAQDIPDEWIKQALDSVLNSGVSEDQFRQILEGAIPRLGRYSGGDDNRPGGNHGKVLKLLESLGLNVVPDETVMTDQFGFGDTTYNPSWAPQAGPQPSDVLINRILQQLPQ